MAILKFIKVKRKIRVDSSEIMLQAKHLIHTSEFSTILEETLFFRGNWIRVFAIIILFCNDVNISISVTTKFFIII